MDLKRYVYDPDLDDDLMFVDDNTIEVRNAPDTGNLEPQPDGGWLAWWKEEQGYRENEKVTCVFCEERDADRGGHVWHDQSLPLYIVPLCASCNADENTDTYSVSIDLLVEEDISNKKSWIKKHIYG